MTRKKVIMIRDVHNPAVTSEPTSYNRNIPGTKTSHHPGISSRLVFVITFVEVGFHVYKSIPPPKKLPFRLRCEVVYIYKQAIHMYKSTAGHLFCGHANKVQNEMVTNRKARLGRVQGAPQLESLFEGLGTRKQQLHLQYV